MSLFFYFVKQWIEERFKYLLLHVTIINRLSSHKIWVYVWHSENYIWHNLLTSKPWCCFSLSGHSDSDVGKYVLYIILTKTIDCYKINRQHNKGYTWISVENDNTWWWFKSAAVLPFSIYSTVSLRFYSSCLRLLPRLCGTNSVFPSIMCFSRQFLLKIWLIHLVCFLFYVELFRFKLFLDNLFLYEICVFILWFMKWRSLCAWRHVLSKYLYRRSVRRNSRPVTLCNTWF